ncbi:MAG: DUF4417 domain-containing protein [Treponema sp.]|nr:DUF4417 domain-containing protein [Treponema sp.]
MAHYCGVCWQRMGLTVIPTASWAEPDSFEYCFDGIETGAVAAVSAMQTISLVAIDLNPDGIPSSLCLLSYYQTYLQQARTLRPIQTWP